MPWPKGRPSPNKGRKASAETRAKIGAATKARWASLSPEQRAEWVAIVQAPDVALRRKAARQNTSIEARHKIGVASKRWWASQSLEYRAESGRRAGVGFLKKWLAKSDEERRAQTAPMVAVAKSEAGRNAMSVATKDRFANMTQAERQAHSASSVHTPAGLARISAANTKRMAAMTQAERSAQARPMIEAARAVTRARFAAMSEDERRAYAMRAVKASRGKKHSSIEVAVEVLLDALGVAYISQHPIDRYCVDFFIPAKRVVIECDGTYWHGLPGRAEADAARDKRLRSLGCVVIRFSESEISALTTTVLASRIA